MGTRPAVAYEYLFVAVPVLPLTVNFFLHNVVIIILVGAGGALVSAATAQNNSIDKLKELLFIVIWMVEPQSRQ